MTPLFWQQGSCLEVTFYWRIRYWTTGTEGADVPCIQEGLQCIKIEGRRSINQNAGKGKRWVVYFEGWGTVFDSDAYERVDANELEMGVLDMVCVWAWWIDHTRNIPLQDDTPKLKSIRKMQPLDRGHVLARKILIVTSWTQHPLRKLRETTPKYRSQSAYVLIWNCRYLPWYKSANDVAGGYPVLRYS